MYKYICILFFLITSLVNALGAPPEDPNSILEEWAKEAIEIRDFYNLQLQSLEEEKICLQEELVLPTLSLERKVEILVEKEIIEQKEKELGDDMINDLSKIRYLKGLSVLKSLYEKVLALDHHFASIQTFSEINKVANPNNYPEFAQVKDKLKSKKNNKFSLDLTGILGNNIYASVTQTFLNLFGADLSGNEKQGELKNIECILDFTLRMHNDLNTIYFETQFLRASNESIKEDLENLFKDYSKPIGYYTSLKECRANDDWDEVKRKLGKYLEEIEAAEGTDKYKKQVNLEFSVDRLMQFIVTYNSFIDQGEKFYEKFAVILNSYENEQQCQSELPIEYTKLKSDIDLAIEKFKVAYKPVEVNGTKMKEILYGINEYE